MCYNHDVCGLDHFKIGRHHALKIRDHVQSHLFTKYNLCLNIKKHKELHYKSKTDVGRLWKRAFSLIAQQYLLEKMDIIEIM